MVILFSEPVSRFYCFRFISVSANSDYYCVLKIGFFGKQICRLNESEISTHTEAERQRDRETDRQTDRPTDSQTSRQNDRQTDRQAFRQTDRQTGRQT